MRNKIKANQTAFKNILDNYHLLSGEEISQAVRYFHTSEEEKKWLLDAKLANSKRITPSIFFTNLVFENKKYLVVIGLNILEDLSEEGVFYNTSVNAGILTILLAETELSLRNNVDVLDFKENILYQHESDEYKGHSYEDIIKYIEPINIYELPNDSIFYNRDTHSTLVYILTKQPQHIYLRLSKLTLDSYLKISLEGAKNLPFENVFSSLVSVNWKHSFLELYRCIERLYPIGFVAELHDELKIQISFQDFLDKLDENIGWKPKEEQALAKLLEKNTEQINLDLDNIKSCISTFSTAPYSTLLYKLRNSIVHYRANHEEIEIEDEMWDKLINVSINIIHNLYSIYNSKLS